MKLEELNEALNVRDRVVYNDITDSVSAKQSTLHNTVGVIQEILPGNLAKVLFSNRKKRVTVNMNQLKRI